MRATSTLAVNVCSVSSTTMLMPATTALLWVWPVSLAASFSSSWTFTFPPWATSETEDVLSCWILSSLVHIQQLSRNMLGNTYNRRRKRSKNKTWWQLPYLILAVPPLGLACFLWFVGFCFLANQWQATSPDELPLAQGSDAARATIAFCFFSILTWVCMFIPVCKPVSMSMHVCPSLISVCIPGLSVFAGNEQV